MKTQALVLAASIAAALPAFAAPKQSDVSPPGGFVAACATSIASDNLKAYGNELASYLSFPAFDGKYSCNAMEFSGAGGSGTASASFAATNIANTAQGSASMGLVRLAATNASPGQTQFAQGAANGGWSDSSTVTIDGLSGSAVWLFDVAFSGNLHTIGGATAFHATAYKNEAELMRSVSGFDPGGSDVFGTDRQRVRWGVTAPNPAVEDARDVLDVVTFAVPVTLGTSFVWGAYGSLYAGQRSMGTGEGRIESAEIGSPFTMRFLGTHGVLVGGEMRDDYQILSGSGIDWRVATPVPEPSAWALMLAGLAAVGVVVRRRVAT